MHVIFFVYVGAPRRVKVENNKIQLKSLDWYTIKRRHGQEEL